MQVPLLHALLTVGCLLSPTLLRAADDPPAVRIHPEEFVQNSAIAAGIKARLAVDHLTRLEHIQVDSDKHGVVWLSGTARSQESIDRALSLTRASEGVRAVQCDVRLLSDD